MELWVRSQDKRKLLKCNDIAVEQNMIDQKEIIKFEGYKIVGYFDKNTEYEELGIYETEERALEILNLIQQRLVNLQLVSLEKRGTAREDVNTRPYLECVFEMPKE